MRRTLVRWCERTGTVRPLLLDLGVRQKRCRNNLLKQEKTGKMRFFLALVRKKNFLQRIWPGSDELGAVGALYRNLQWTPKMVTRRIEPENDG